MMEFFAKIVFLRKNGSGIKGLKKIYLENYKNYTPQQETLGWATNRQHYF